MPISISPDRQIDACSRLVLDAPPKPDAAVKSVVGSSRGQRFLLGDLGDRSDQDGILLRISDFISRG
jgi:hypothetical protein